MLNMVRSYQPLALLALLACGVCCAPNDENSRMSAIKPNQPPVAVGVPADPTPVLRPERGTQGVTASPASPIVSAAIADQQGQAFNLARDKERDPVQWLPAMATRSSSVVVGKVVDDRTLPYVSARATKHKSTIQVIETWVGAPVSSFEVTWTEIAGFSGLTTNQTYVLFLVAGSGEIWCIDDPNAAMPVTSGVVNYRGKTLALGEARQATTAAN